MDRHFGGDPAVLGTTIGLNQRPHTVIGVMPPSFDFSAHGEELWIPARRASKLTPTRALASSP